MPLNIQAESGWDPKIENKFFLPLTYPHSEWRGDDFGQEVSQGDRQLLERFKPEIYIGPDSFYPVDFYKHILPRSILNVGKERKKYKSVNREQLKKYEREASAYLDYEGPLYLCKKSDCPLKEIPIYGRVYRESLKNISTNLGDREILVLKYTAVFTSSGLPAQIGWWKSFGASLLGSKKVWHELDIHGAVHILVDKTLMKPVALVLAQHNHFRTYIIGKQIHLNSEGRLSICFAQRSNEPYPCHLGSEKKSYRTVGDPAKFGYIITGKNGGLESGSDVVYGPQSGGILVSYHLKFLPTKDPLYVSWISLGDHLKIMGVFPSFFRSGPPGIDLNTFPELKKYTDIAQFWYFKQDDLEAINILETHVKGFFEYNLNPVLMHNGQKFRTDLGELIESSSTH